MFVIKTISEYLVLQDAGNTKKAINLYQPANLLPRLHQPQRETNAAVEASPELSDIKDGLVDIDSLTTAALSDNSGVEPQEASRIRRGFVVSSCTCISYRWLNK